MSSGRSSAPARGARAATAAGGRPRPAAQRPGRRRRRRRGFRASPRLLVAVGVALALVAGAFLWLRQSSLVGVRRVAITGVSGPDAGQIRAALRRAARTMTTLDVRPVALHNAVAPYPEVKHVRISTAFPHTMRIAVVEQVPVAELVAQGVRAAVSGDGTLLRPSAADGPLPTISLTVPPGGTHLTGNGLAEARLLAAAPYTLLSHIQAVTSDRADGFYAQLRNGPKVIIGAPTSLAAKWSAAVAVLADPSSDGAGYIDVTDPARPAAGAGSSPASASSAATSPWATASSPTSGSAGGAAASATPTGGG